MLTRYVRVRFALLGCLFGFSCGSSGSNDGTLPPTEDAGGMDAAPDAMTAADAFGSDGGAPDGSRSDGAASTANSFAGSATVAGASLNLSANPIEPFTFHLSDTWDSLVVGWHGDVATVPLQKVAGEWIAAAPISLNRPCAHNLYDILDTFALSKIAFHRSASGIVGTLTGNVMGTQEDVLLGGDVTADFTADVDTSMPALGGGDSCGTTGDLTLALPIMMSLQLVLTEPLVAGTKAHIVSMTNAAKLPIGTDQTAGPVTRFGGDFVFAFGSVYQVAIDPFVDLAGVAGARLPTITTPSVGFLATDGFETSSPMEVTGGTATVSDPSLVITGVQSLQIPSAGGFAARLHVAPGNTTLSANIRPVIPANSEGGNLSLLVGVPEGQLVMSSQSAILMQTVPTVTIQGISAVTIALPPGVKDEVIVQIEASGGSLIFGGQGATFVVDDLMLH